MYQAYRRLIVRGIETFTLQVATHTNTQRCELDLRWRAEGMEVATGYWAWTVSWQGPERLWRGVSLSHNPGEAKPRTTTPHGELAISSFSFLFSIVRQQWFCRTCGEAGDRRQGNVVAFNYHQLYPDRTRWFRSCVYAYLRHGDFRANG